MGKFVAGAGTAKPPPGGVALVICVHRLCLVVMLDPVNPCLPVSLPVRVTFVDVPCTPENRIGAVAFVRPEFLR